jgi:TPR repeat protein
VILATLMLCALAAEPDADTTACKAEDGAACMRLAARSLTGDGVAQDVHYAMRKWSEACRAGHGPGCTAQGDAFAQGDLVALDYIRAAELYTDACSHGHGPGCRALGELYIMGALGTIDGATAGIWYQQGCEAGDAESCTAVGLWLERGDTGSKDPDAARELFRRACGMGHARGCTQIGVRLLVGDGVKRDLAAAAGWFEKGCRARDWDPESCREWGRAQIDGRVAPLEPLQGRVDLERACYAGDHVGCRYLADLLRKSAIEEALIAAERGCDLGDAQSCTKAERLRYRMLVKAEAR